MQNNIIKILMLVVFISFPLCVKSEIIQLIEESVFNKPDLIPNYTGKQLKDIYDVKMLLIQFIKSPVESQIQSLSTKYKRIFQNIERELIRAFGKETYSRIDFRKVEYHSEKSMTVKANLFWQDEGYEGVQTFYFKIIKAEGKWLIDWIVY